MMRVEFVSGKKFIFMLELEFIICMWLGLYFVKFSLRVLAKVVIFRFKMLVFLLVLVVFID